MAQEPLDVVDFVVTKGHGVCGLANAGLERIPNRYLQPEDERFDASKAAIDETIPLIDVSDWGNLGTAKSICEAAKSHGFFQIINHGVPLEVLDEVQAAVHRFFQQPTEEKIKYKEEGLSVSGGAKLTTSFSPDHEKVLEWKDCLSLHYSTDEAASQNWPPICRNEALVYYKKIQPVIEKILGVLLKGLGIQSGLEESKRSLLMGWIATNLNYYPKCPNPDLAVGIGRHSDGSALTLLLQDDVGGLYVRALKDETKWLHVPPIRGALVINIGDALQIFSNGEYQSVEHRVVTNASKDRISVAVFASPGLSEVIGPLPETIGQGESKVYRDVLFGDYCKYYFGRRLDGKKGIEWAKI